MTSLLVVILMLTLIIYAFTYWKEIVAFSFALLVLLNGEYVTSLLVGLFTYFICWIISAINRKKGAKNDIRSR